MNSQELKDLLDYIQKNNSWEYMSEAFDKDRYVFKYIDICYDTREGTTAKEHHVWSITLRQSNNEFITFQEDEIKEIYKFLDKPMKEVSEILKQKAKERENARM